MYCHNCNIEIEEEDVIWQTEDMTSTVPYGGTFVDMDGVDNVPYCPICDEEIE